MPLTPSPSDGMRAYNKTSTDEGALRCALVAGDWYLYRAAHLLGVQVSTLQRWLDRHPEIEAERKAHARPRGRPPGKQRLGVAEHTAGGLGGRRGTR